MILKKMKNYLISVLNDIMHDQTGQVGYDPHSGWKYTPSYIGSVISPYVKKAGSALKSAAGTASDIFWRGDYSGLSTSTYPGQGKAGLPISLRGKAQSSSYTPGSLTPPKISPTPPGQGEAGIPLYIRYASHQTSPKPEGRGEIVTSATGDDVLSWEDYFASVSGSLGTGGGGDVSVPEAPDLGVELTPEQIAQLEREANKYAMMGYEPQLRELDRALRENLRMSQETEEKTIPTYERSMRSVAGAVANAIADYAQRLNKIGRLEGGQYGEGAEKLQSAGIRERSALEQALNERLTDIRTARDEYERNINELRAGVEREKGLYNALTFERLKREALETERDIRQQTFDNEMARSNFIATMNQMIWERKIRERQLAAEIASAKAQNALAERSLEAQIANMNRQYATATQGQDINRFIPVKIGGQITYMYPNEYMAWEERNKPAPAQTPLDKLLEELVWKEASQAIAPYRFSSLKSNVTYAIK